MKERFSIPSGITSDMGSGILLPATEVFPAVPVRICLTHLLRDLGKYLMEEMHPNLGRIINRIRIKSPLKKILRSILDYDQKTLYGIENRYCIELGRMEVMAVRRMLEKVLQSTNSSGYGFPFSLKLLNFFLACVEADKNLADLSRRINGKGLRHPYLRSGGRRERLFQTSS